MVSLNDINNEADQRYGPFVIEDVPGGDVVLRNSIRLTRNEREQFAQLDAKIKATKGNLNAALEIATEVLVLVGTGDDGKRLVEALGDDPPKLMHLLTLYREATQPGEALPSES